MAVIVSAAFLASGGLNAGTPLAIASTPVSATEPPANALQEQEDARAARSRTGTASGGGGSGSAVPVTMSGQPDGDDPQREPDEQVGRDREDVPGLAQAAEVARS